MFKRMDQSSKEDWDHIYNEHLPHVLDMPNRIISMLKQLEGLTLGFGTNQLHHALQTATMARKAGASDEMVLISLIHDMGKVINVPNHGQICAEIIKPYVSSDAYYVIKTHQDFQGNIIIIIRASHAIYESNTLMNHGMKKLLNLQINGIRLHLILNIKLIHWNHLNH